MNNPPKNNFYGQQAGWSVLLSQANALHIPLPAKLVHTVTTSTPYWSQRIYDGAEPILWPAITYTPILGLPAVTIPGCDEQCDHQFEPVRPHKRGQVEQTLWRSAAGSGSGQRAVRGAYCARCGGWAGPFGNEPEPYLYIAHLVLIFREVRRVLRDDGVAWLNLGDSYYNGQDTGETGNLVGIPAQAFLALQGDGWIVRNDNVWIKRSPLPESITGWQFRPLPCQCRRGRKPADPDCLVCLGSGHRPGKPGLRRHSWRHTRAHEFLFMLTKQMGYWADGDRVQEQGSKETIKRLQRGMSPNNKYTNGAPGQLVHGNVKPRPNVRKGSAGGPFSTDYHNNRQKQNGPPGEKPERLWRNPRTALTTEATQEVPADLVAAFARWLRKGNPLSHFSPRKENYRGNHYAVFPPGLIKPAIQATCPTACCPFCGQGYAPIYEKETDPATWERVQTCQCPPADPVPGIVLDPFSGSGTTGLVARQLALRAICLDISHTYLEEQAKYRTGIATRTAMISDKRPPKRVEILDDLPLFAAISKTAAGSRTADTTAGTGLPVP